MRCKTFREYKKQFSKHFQLGLRGQRVIDCESRDIKNDAQTRVK